MSTTPQDHSIQHQCEHLQNYALEHHIEIVKIYADAGKSGLSFRGREGLQRLIGDVQENCGEFEYILVHDVSRWGRFQDVDESAHYEYICRQAGVKVVYCAEQFENDGSALSALLKGIKRTMAAEYSRELSDKVFAAQCKFAALGYKMGGTAGYAIRRLVFDKDGKPKPALQHGERKARLTDRVRYGLGPLAEIEIVRRIYSLYLDRQCGDTEIACILNAENVPGEFGQQWRPWHIKSILTNEKYIGNVVFNKRSAKLKRGMVYNPPEAWVRMDGAMPSIISKALFDQAHAARILRLAPWGRDELLGMLRSLHRKHGKVTAELINAERGYPAPRYFKSLFGTLADAYLLAGLPPTKTLQYARTKHAVRQMLHMTMAVVQGLIERAGGTSSTGATKWQMRVNDSLTLKIVVARSRHDQDGRVRWRIPIYSVPVSDFVICVQLDQTNVGPKAYFLLPVADFTQGHIILRNEFIDEYAQYRYSSLVAIFGGTT